MAIVMADIKVHVLTSSDNNGGIQIARVFDSMQSLEGYIVGLVRLNRLDKIAGLEVSTHQVWTGAHGNQALYTRAESAVIGEFVNVESTAPR